LASLALQAHGAPAVTRRLFEERGLLSQLTRLKVYDWHPLPPLPGAPNPGHLLGGMRMEDLDVRAAAALAAWPMPQLRPLVLSSEDPATLRTLLRAPWAAGLGDLQLS
jgi:hypothetical protein